IQLAVPDFMGFPVEAVVEEVEPAQIRKALLPAIGVGRRASWRTLTMAMTGGIRKRMRKAAWDEGVRRKRLVGQPARRFAQRPAVFRSGSMSLIHTSSGASRRPRHAGQSLWTTLPGVQSRL